jgi:hypothetical protein
MNGGQCIVLPLSLFGEEEFGYQEQNELYRACGEQTL